MVSWLHIHGLNLKGYIYKITAKGKRHLISTSSWQDFRMLDTAQHNMHATVGLLPLAWILRNPFVICRHKTSGFSQPHIDLLRRIANAITELAHEILASRHLEDGIPFLVGWLEFNDTKVQRVAKGHFDAGNQLIESWNKELRSCACESYVQKPRRNISSSVIDSSAYSAISFSSKAYRNQIYSF
ncbi:hypothetical protein VNO77_08032 [Canavalia gladiata]|uniref:Uncharacterized protein n=1 Tax=Canavalia gladiata TaxID=3824 RepID=A0AAN9MDM3_CANGL